MKIDFAYYNKKQSRHLVNKMAAIGRLITRLSTSKLSCPRINGIGNESLLLCIGHQSRYYRGSNRNKRIRAENKKKRISLELETKYGISDRKEFNFNVWMKINYFKELTAFQNRVGVIFKDEGLLLSAFAHPSFSEEAENLAVIKSTEGQSTAFPDLNERLLLAEKLSNIKAEKLTLLGYNIVESIIKERLYKRYPNITSTICADVYKFLMSRETVVMLAKNLGVGDFLLVSKQLENIEDYEEEYHLEFTPEDLLSDCFYGLIGAIELDCGKDVVQKFIDDFIITLIDYVDLAPHIEMKDPELELTKIFKLNNVNDNWSQQIIVETGDSTFPVYVCGIYVKDIKVGEGFGYNIGLARTDAVKNTIFSCLEGEIDFNHLSGASKLCN